MLVMVLVDISMRIVRPVFILMSIVATQTVFSDKSTAAITWIKKEYGVIRENLKKYKKESFEIFGESTEGADAVGYVSGKGDIKLIEATYFGELGKNYFEFYYFDNKPFFVYNRYYRYNTHFMMTKEVVEESFKRDGTKYEVFDPKKTIIEEYRYYVYKNKIIKMILPKGGGAKESRESGYVVELSQKNIQRLNEQLHPK